MNVTKISLARCHNFPFKMHLIQSWLGLCPRPLAELGKEMEEGEEGTKRERKGNWVMGEGEGGDCMERLGGKEKELERAEVGVHLPF